MTYWYINDQGRIINNYIPVSIDDIFSTPYPATFWYLDEYDILKNFLLPQELVVEDIKGAFCGVTSLEYVKIPKSVTSIGKYSFYDTNLKTVCIPKGCTYHATSFPPDCKVVFYEDIYNLNYQITVAGVNSYRYTDIIVHDEESTTCEIP
jgi:hypothetical protein